jgi:serine protease Do
MNPLEDQLQMLNNKTVRSANRYLPINDPRRELAIGQPLSRADCGKGKICHCGSVSKWLSIVYLRAWAVQGREAKFHRPALVIRPKRGYSSPMLKQCVCLFLGCLAAQAATVELKGKASVTGTILAQKRDQIVIDIGYTVLVIPRDQVLKLLNDNEKAAKAIIAPTPATAAAPVQAMPDSVAGQGFFRTAPASVQEQNVRELVKTLGSAVVQVRTPEGLGSGFFINPDGFLITNFHVVEGETQISVEVYDVKDGQLERKSYKKVRIIALNKFGDLALLHIEDKDAPKFASVPLGDSDKVSVGDRVFAIGSPLGLERTVTEGILSTKTREIEGGLYLQTSAQINPGNSGGPLFNLRGEVVGVTNMKASFGEGLGFAIPVEFVKYFLNHRDAFAYENDNPSNPYRYLEPPSRVKKAVAE